MGSGTCYPFVIDYLKMKIKPGDLVVETGCGGALYRAVVAENQASYLGCDIANDQYANYRDVDVFSNGNELPLRKGSISLIFNQAAFDYIPNPHQTISEAYRVLRPGGKFIIFTYKKKVLKEIDRNCKIRGRKWELNHHVYSRNDVLSWLTEAGFKAEDIGKKIDLVGSTGWKRKLLEIFGLYMPVQAKYSHWLVIEAVKPK
jgi:ubiquinone/menaquinone biosynthesis C-methylase UbiE